MAIDTTNNNIVYEFLTEPRFGLSRRVLIVAMLIGCSFGQVFLMIESIGYCIYNRCCFSITLRPVSSI